MDLSSLAAALEDIDCCSQESTDQLVVLLRQAYPHYHDNAPAMLLIGQKCRDEQLYEQSEFFLGRALELSPNSPAVKENVRHLHEKMVDRWHFAMLNDVQRNSSYFRAILKAVRRSQDCTVLDIGSGTGILRFVLILSSHHVPLSCFSQ